MNVITCDSCGHKIDEGRVLRYAVEAMGIFNNIRKFFIGDDWTQVDLCTTCWEGLRHIGLNRKVANIPND